MKANANKHTGIVTISLGGTTAKLVYDYAAIAEFQNEFGQKADINDFKIDQIVDTLLIGLKRHNPEITKEQVYAASPPMAEISDWIIMAFIYSQHGPEKGGLVIDETRKVVDDLEKKTKAVTPATTKKAAPKPAKKSTKSRKT